MTKDDAIKAIEGVAERLHRVYQINEALDGFTSTVVVMFKDAIRALPDAGWRDIESAPETGETILAYRSDAGVFTAHYVEDDAHLSSPMNPPEGECYWFTTGGDDLTDDMPTHWMPLPPPPESVMDIIERAARALYECQPRICGWDAMPRESKLPFIKQARAVLSALREPDDAMERMGDLQSGDCIATWQAMIDQALKG